MYGARFTTTGGVGTSKMLAKFAASVFKPNDQSVILPHHTHEFMAAMPVRKLPGMGNVQRCLGAMHVPLTDTHAQELGDVSVSNWLPSRYGQHDEFRNALCSAHRCSSGVQMHTVGDVRKLPLSVLTHALGSSSGELVYRLCRGIDNTLVTPFSAPKTISDEDSFKRYACGLWYGSEMGAHRCVRQAAVTACWMRAVDWACC